MIPCAYATESKCPLSNFCKGNPLHLCTREIPKGAILTSYPGRAMRFCCLQALEDWLAGNASRYLLCLQVALIAIWVTDCQPELYTVAQIVWARWCAPKGGIRRLTTSWQIWYSVSHGTCVCHDTPGWQIMRNLSKKLQNGEMGSHKVSVLIRHKQFHMKCRQYILCG